MCQYIVVITACEERTCVKQNHAISCDRFLSHKYKIVSGRGIDTPTSLLGHVGLAALLVMHLRQKWEDHKLMFGIYMVGFLVGVSLVLWGPSTVAS